MPDRLLDVIDIDIDVRNYNYKYCYNYNYDYIITCLMFKLVAPSETAVINFKIKNNTQLLS